MPLLNKIDIYIVKDGATDIAQVLQVAMYFRYWGYSVVHDYDVGRSVKAQMRDGDKQGCKHAVILKSGSVEKVSIRYMERGFQIDNVTIYKETPLFSGVRQLRKYIRPSIFTLPHDLARGDWLYYGKEKSWHLFLEQRAEDDALVFVLSNIDNVPVAELNSALRHEALLLGIFNTFPYCVVIRPELRSNPFVELSKYEWPN